MTDDEVKAVAEAIEAELMKFDPDIPVRQRRLNAARAAISKLDEMRGDRLAKEAAFLIDRLTDFENDGDTKTEDGERDWHGHIAPSISRLRGYLPPPPPTEQQ